MTTVTFKFEQKGFNAHTAKGVLKYETTEGAQQAIDSMSANPGYTNIHISPDNADYKFFIDRFFEELKNENP
jgi:hypothetical protein